MGNFKKLIIGLALTTMAFTSLVGCGKKPSNQQSSGPKEHTAVSKTIGTGGGFLKDGTNVNITIPEGALKESTTISALYIEDATLLSNDISMGFLGAVEFGPSGTTFDKPVEVSLKLANPTSFYEVAVFCYDEESNRWDYVCDAEVEETIATFKVTHFSKYELLNLTQEMYLKFYDLVYEAVLNDKSDAWISESYKEYLVDYEHVMDLYTKYGNYWYEPCGLFVYGDYLINGKSGDQEALHFQVGESNKVGDKYGVSTVGGLFAKKSEFEKAKRTATETTQIIDVTVVLEYRMIKPVIQLSAAKYKLKKNESTTVTVFCHYSNPNNYFSQFQDLILDNYDLDLKVDSNHLKLEKDHVVTNGEGKATFQVTSNDAKADTVRAIFDVSGDFGTHAEGNTRIQGNEKIVYNMSGHIHEEWNYVTGSSETEDYSDSWESLIYTGKTGSVNISVDYDFAGTIAWTSGISIYGGAPVEGEISMSNVEVNVSSSPSERVCTIDHPMDKYQYECHSVEKFTDYPFESPQVEVRPAPKSTFYGEQIEEPLVSWWGYSKEDEDFYPGDYFIIINAQSCTHREYDYHRIDLHNPDMPIDETHHEEGDEYNDEYWRIYYGMPLLMCFEEKEGTQTCTIDDYFNEMGSGDTIWATDENRTTTQTITLTKQN